MQQQIYQTADTPLAVTLATCGVPFDADPRTGQPMPFLHYYSAEILAKLGYKGSGLTIEEAARDALNRGRSGQIVYCFQRVAPIEDVLKAYQRHAAAIAAANQTAGGHGSQVLARMPAVPPDLAAQICCQFAANRSAMLTGWKTAVPWIHYPGEMREESEGGVTYRVGSFKLVPLGATAATKARIGL